MVQLGPTSIPQSWDWCSGYHASDSTVIGFSHTHLSGTGIGDLFDVTVMPVTGEVTYSREGLWSYGNRSEEVSRPGYYSIPLERYGIKAELTATSRVGFHRYTFPESKEAAIVFDLENGGCWDRVTSSGIEVIDSVSIQGWRYSTGWAKDQKQYFYARFSMPFTIEPGTPENYWRFNFSTGEGERLLLKVALSPIGTEGARKALETEIPDWDFDAVCQAAKDKWNSELGKIDISTEDSAQKTIFYTPSIILWWPRPFSRIRTLRQLNIPRSLFGTLTGPQCRLPP
jgi:putative alpha-1,2-mannosidase